MTITVSVLGVRLVTVTVDRDEPDAAEQHPGLADLGTAHVVEAWHDGQDYETPARVGF